jgi:hypothetical protein
MACTTRQVYLGQWEENSAASRKRASGTNRTVRIPGGPGERGLVSAVREATRAGLVKTDSRRGLGRGARKTQTEWRSSAGALRNTSPPPLAGRFVFIIACWALRL